MDAAACLGADPEQWFPARENDAEAVAAVAVCLGCPVRAACLEYALQAALDYGIFAGTTPTQRRHLRKVRGITGARWRGPLVPHGTPGAYKRHLRAGERPCDTCARAEQLRQAPYNAARRAAP